MNTSFEQCNWVIKTVWGQMLVCSFQSIEAHLADCCLYITLNALLLWSPAACQTQFKINLTCFTAVKEEQKEKTGSCVHLWGFQVSFLFWVSLDNHTYKSRYYQYLVELLSQQAQLLSVVFTKLLFVSDEQGQFTDGTVLEFFRAFLHQLTEALCLSDQHPPGLQDHNRQPTDKCNTTERSQKLKRLVGRGH